MTIEYLAKAETDVVATARLDKTEWAGAGERRRARHRHRRQRQGSRARGHQHVRLPEARVRGLTSASTWKLIGADGKPFASPVPGTLGGHRKTKIYGRLDCRAALQAIARGGYVASACSSSMSTTAASAGFRPCAVCMPESIRAVEGSADAAGQAAS